jgi:hypothetical protein
MGLIPMTEIPGAPTVKPRFWPMHVGAARPRRVEACRTVAWRIELAWDDAGHLLEVREWIEPKPVQRRAVYRWRGDELEGIRYFDADLVDVLGDEPSSEELWTWVDGKPREVRHPREDGADTHLETWNWGTDGRSVTIAESSDTGIISTNQVTFDTAGRIVKSELRITLGGKHTIAEATWSDEHTIVEARMRNMAAPDRAKLIGFRYDDAGRLIAQTSSNPPGGDEWLYRYDTP